MASIEKRGSKYRAVVSYTDGNGIRRKASKTFPMKKEAVKWSAEMESKVKSGIDFMQGKILITDYYRQWVKNFKDKNIRESTRVRYTVWQQHVNELFENIPLNKLTTQIIQSKLDEFGETHLTSTVQQFTISLRSALKDAQIDGLIDRDIYSRLKPHGNDNGRKKAKKYLDEAEFFLLRDYLYDHTSDIPDEPALIIILVVLETGACFGEVYALQESDFDYTNNTVSITKSFSSAVKKITEPKNQSSIRTVSIPETLSEVVQNYFASQDGKRLMFNASSSSSAANYSLHKLTTKLGITNITFHGLRHSHVSYLLHNNIDINYISKRVGHANTTVTLSTYAHMLKEKELTQDKLALKVLGKGKK